MAKMNRERAVKERRALKAEKKQAKKDAAAGLNTGADDSTLAASSGDDEVSALAAPSGDDEVSTLAAPAGDDDVADAARD